MISTVQRKLHNLIHDERFSEILTGSAWALASRLVVTLLSLLSTVLVARAYGAEMLGVLAVLNSFLLMSGILSTLGTQTSILRLVPEHIARYSVSSAFGVYRQVLFLVTSASLLIGGFLLIASGTVAETVFSKPHLQVFLAMAACFVVARSAAELSVLAIRGLKRIKTFAVLSIVHPAAVLVVLVALTLISRHPSSPVYAHLAAWGIAAVVAVRVTDRAFKSGMQAGDEIQKTSLREIVSLSFPMLMTASINFILNQTGVLMLGMFRTEHEIGYYSAAVRLVTLTSFMLHAVNTMAAPRFAELYHSGKVDELLHVARKSTKLIFWTTAPVSVALMVLGSPILVILFGSDFAAAGWAMIFLLIGQTFNALSGSTGIFLNMTGNQKALRNILLGSAIVNVGLNLVLIPGFGIVGAAVAGMISTILWNGLALIMIRIRFGVSIAYVPMWGRTRTPADPGGS